MPIGKEFKGHAMEKVPAWHLMWWLDKLTGDPARRLTADETAVINYINENLDVLKKEIRESKGTGP